MRLSRVRIFGFKTFADRTDVRLDGDIIAIVGPNGCGKSNIVDAILWGLGEPNVRELRAATSQDVIFSGSKDRKPLGFAEVHLFFENEDRVLPIEADEVMVSRKLTRSGDSEYRINGRAVRQRDVFELLADTGLGRTGYSIVGQKDIDQALAASAEERRAWIDEAAGVQRYRARKNEAIRRITQARDHLDRVNDILAEIERQRAPLAEEAVRAKRFIEIRDALERVEIGLLAHEYGEAEAALARVLEQRAEIDRGIERELEESERIAATMLEAEREVEKLRSAISDVSRQLESTRAEIAFAEAEIRLESEKIAGLEALGMTLAEEEARAAKRRAELEEEIAEAEAALSHAEACLQEHLSGLADVEAEHRALVARRDAAQRDLEEARNKEQARLRAVASAASRAERLSSIAAELEGIQAAIPDLESGLAESNAALAAIEGRLRDAEAERLERARAVEAALADVDERHQDRRRVASELAVAEAKARGLASTLDSLDGFSQGARAVMEAVQRGELTGEFAPVATAFATKPKYATAIETALGAAANDLIVPHDRMARSAIEYLKQHRLGRATFQPLNLVRASHESRTVPNRKGIVGRAVDLVECREDFRPVAQSLLGRTLVVETLDDAIQAQRDGAWAKIVTLDGDLVHASGSVTGGRHARQTDGPMKRRAELDELERAIAVLQQEAAQYDQQLAATADSIEGLKQALAESVAQVSEIQEERAEARDWHAKLQHELEATVRATHRLEAERVRLNAEDAPTLDSVNLDAVQAEMDQATVALAEFRARHEALAGESERLEKEVDRGKERLSAAQRRLKALEHEVAQRQHRSRGMTPQRADAESRIAAHREAVARHQVLLSGLQDKGRRLADALQESQERHGAESRRLAQSNDARRAYEERALRLEIERTRAEAKRAQVVQRLIEEYGLGEDRLEQVATDDLPEDAAALVSRLRRELRAMGDVNVGAIALYESLESRHREYSIQLEDVLAGIAQIEATISELDRLTRDKFLRTFEAVQVSFRSTFQALFGGGEADIQLSDPENVLQSGIQIDVTVPGKRRQRLELLSGGERSLCANAFLFALLDVHPSPLVVLDEVDAPLDGRNVERFVDLLESFTGRTQFVVITHNPATIERAPVWLGVSMEAGVTKVIPFRAPAATAGSEAAGTLARAH